MSIEGDRLGETTFAEEASALGSTLLHSQNEAGITSKIISHLSVMHATAVHSFECVLLIARYYALIMVMLYVTWLCVIQSDLFNVWM